MLRLLTAAAVLLFLGSPLGAPLSGQAPTPVPINNGSFDQGVDADGVPVGWRLYGGSPDATLAIGPEGSGLIIDDQDTAAEVGVVQTFPLEPGGGYEVSVKVRAFQGRTTAGAYVQLRFLPSQQYAQASLVTASHDGWEEIALRALSPDDTIEARLYLYTHRQPTPKVMITDVMVLGGVEPPPPPPPDPVPPVYSGLKDMHQRISLVADGRPACAIVAPAVYAEAAAVVRDAIRERSGVEVPIVSDRSQMAAVPLVGNLVVLGNRSTNRASSALYDLHYSLADLKYPGRNGYAVRTLHDPFGGGHSAVLVGGSDAPGVLAGAVAWAESLALEPAERGELAIGWTMLTRLGAGLAVPSDLRQFEIWEASKGYASVGYFGWNSISKRMAMYYMTGDPFHAREVIRLSFPDARAMRELEEVDGERIENKRDPLAGPYHYNALMLILYWDLIEESPEFTDAERLAVTNAFARRLAHPQDRSTYFITATPAGVGSRHHQWSALSLYALGRYFQKHYPSAVWAQAKRAGELAFSSLDRHAWVSGENDNLYWYGTAIAPVLTYLVLTGHRAPIENGVLGTLLAGQEALISGRMPDWALNYAALDFLHKAAYLTGDGRWIAYRERTGLDTEVFRLGQSFWPGDELAPAQPTDLAGRWLVHPLPGPMWLARSTGFALEQSFQWMSYRSTAGGGGDFLLVDGYNGAARNPYHTYDLLELRLAGRTLLEGYMNQVLTSADGMVEPLVPLDGQLLFRDVIGSTAIVVGQVPDMPYADWRRTIAQRVGRYALVVDDISFRASSENMKVSTSWQFTGGVWDAGEQAIRARVPGWAVHIPIAVRPAPALAGAALAAEPGFDSAAASAARQVTLSFELRPSDEQETIGRNPLYMNWEEAVAAGQRRHAFYLIGRTASNRPGALECLRIGPNAAALGLPEPALAVAGSHDGIAGDLVVLAADHLLGHGLTRAGLAGELIVADEPVDVEWDFAEGVLHVVAATTTRLAFAADGRLALVDGRPGRLAQRGSTCAVTLERGRHVISGLRPLDDGLRDGLAALAGDGRALRRAAMAATPAPTPSVPHLLPEAKADVGGAVTFLEVLAGTEGPLIAVVHDDAIHILTPEGAPVRTLRADATILSLRWWAKPRLLLAGCRDEKVIAFDEAGARRWVFTSEMDPAVTEAGKTYWYKSAPGHEGVRGLFSGTFLDDEEQAFIGSACTLEIIDEEGRLLERAPFFWGPGSVFQLVPKPDGSIDLLIGREPADGAHLWVYNNRTRARRQAFHRVPPGHTYVGGWANMGRDHIFVADVAGDGTPEVVSEINGTWNRVTVWDLEGAPLFNAQFGAGKATPFRNMRDLDLVDLTGDGKLDMIVATSDGMVVALDGQCRRLWSVKLTSAATVLAAVPGDANRSPRVALGCEDGSVLVLDADGVVLRRGALRGAAARIALAPMVDGVRVVVGTATGEVAWFEP